MRGDKSPPTISTNHYNKLLSIGTERHMGRSLQYSALHECRDSACRSGAIAALSKKITSHPKQKTSPRAPALNKAKQLFVLQGRVLLGEVLGERGRFGGREPRLSRGGSLPPRSFPSPPRPSSLPTYHLASRAGGEGVEKKRAAGGETNAQTRVTAFPNPPRHPPERRRA